MPQLASLSWFFISIFFISLLVLCSVSLWWFNFVKVFDFNFNSNKVFNHWDW